MLTLDGHAYKHCDGVSRRSFLKIGSLGIGGLSLPALLHAEQSQGLGSSRKSIIHIHLDGGPPQMDMIDPKPDMPREFRSPFASIPTKLPGVHVTELMPKTAAIADKLVFLRSLVGADGQHNAFQCQSGFLQREMAAIGGRPALGCVLHKLLSTAKDEVPVFVDLMQGRALVRNSARPGFLGPSCKPFRPDISKMFKRELEEGMKGELARLGMDHSTRLVLDESIPVHRLDDRLDLLSRLDDFKRKVDRDAGMTAMDRFTEQAYNILTSGKFAEAMDLEREDPKVVERYTPTLRDGGKRFFTSEGPVAARKLLLARRMVEAGVRCVSVSISDFDTHQKNNPRMKDLVPIFDHALHALITDLEERGMLDDVTILAWGEFGRTPKVNKDGGRDHWPRVAMGLMAGGGMPVGQVIGATDRMAGEATSRPIHYQDVVATLYSNLGINPGTVTVPDPTGRPQFLVEHGKPIRELV